MSRSHLRLLLLIAAAVLVGELAMSSRNTRNKPSLVQPRQLDGEGRTMPTGQFPGNAGNHGLPPNFPIQREQETTIRPQAAPSSPTPAAQLRPIDLRSEEQLIALVDEAIDKTEHRYLDVAEYTPWQIMHGVLALRSRYMLKQGDRLVNGIDFISSGPVYRGESWWVKTPYGGRGHPFTVPYAFEGHINQFPALLAMSALPLDHKLITNQGPITVADIVKNAQMTANTQEEVSWTIWFLTQYINQDSRWVNQHNQPWSMAELIRHQVNDKVENAPCGGTHGLYALAFSRNAYLQQHGKLQGVWMNSEYKLRQYIELARQLQNSDGTFSSNWFKGRGYSADFKERIKTSGHMLEWLMMALPTSRLSEPWVRRGVQAVATDLIRNASAPAECGPMYHALHALVLYRERVGPAPTTPDREQLAGRPTTGANPAPPPRTATPATASPSSGAPSTSSPSPGVASTREPAPTNPPASLIPDAPAPAIAQTPGRPNSAAPSSGQPQSSSAAVLTAPSIIAPGPGYLSPGAPASIAATPAAPATPATVGSSGAPATLLPPAAAPGMLGARDARPLIVIEPKPVEGDAAGNPREPTAETPATTPPATPAVAGQRPLLILKEPVAPTPESPMERTSPPRSITVAPPAPYLGEPTAGTPTRTPPAVAQTGPPADLPTEAFGSTPAAEPTPRAARTSTIPAGTPGQIGTAEAQGKPVLEPRPEADPAAAKQRPSTSPDDRPLQPQLAADPPSATPPATAESSGPAPEETPTDASPRSARKPSFTDTPPAPIRTASQPDAGASTK